MQSNDSINLEIINPYGSQKINNSHSYHAEDNWDFLCKVYQKEIPMFSQAYSILANTMELFYKGVYLELKKIHPEMPNMSDYEFHQHRFTGFIQAINRIIPVSASKEGYYTILDNADRIYKGYTDAKYQAMYEYKDFEADFRRYEVQRKRLYTALEVEKQKYEAREIMNLPNEKSDDDLDYWK